MKRHFLMIMATLLATSFTACGNSEQKNQISSEKVETQSQAAEIGEEKGIESSTDKVTEAVTENATDKSDNEMEELSAIGNVEVENGLLTVSITLPADFVGDTTQDELDANANGNYVAAKLNEDGSVTYKLTKSQHKAMLDQIMTSMNESLQELIDDDTYSIADIKVNDTLTKFDVIMDGDEVGFADSFTTIVFYMEGGIYGRFTGKMPENIEVNFISPDGKIIETANSKDMNN